MKHEILPAVLAGNADEALQKIRQVEGQAPWIQWDVMDGKFVRQTTWSDASCVKIWKIKPKIELHLMVNQPEPIIREWRPAKNFKRAVWHVEAPVDHAKLIAACHRMGLEAGLAVSPETPVASLVPFLRKIDTVLVLGVHPGRSGQSLIPATVKKVQELRKLAPRLAIGFDGGLDARNLPRVARAGASRLCIASAIFGNKNPRAALPRLQKALKRV